MAPLVSVVTITYNHERYISNCIEGVLSQITNFPIEFIIAEDCSTDRTRIICEDYARIHPEMIRLITSENNLGYNANELRAMKSARGKYIAYCEGDDFWTDCMKLQKQVDFLESHPMYSICFHRCRHWDADSGKYMEDACGNLFASGEEGVDVSIEMFFKKWITQPLSMVFRVDCFDMSLYKKYRYYRDMHQIYHLLIAGKGYLFAFDGGVRTIHIGGIASKLNVAGQCRNGVAIARELYQANKDVYTKNYYTEMLQWYLYNIHELKGKRLYYSIELLFLTGNLKKFIHNLIR